MLVALSEDGGRTWTTKELPGTLPHDDDGPPWGTIGYSVARQAPNGVIHLATSKTDPIYHFELNEAWILDAEAGMEPAVADGSARLVSAKKYLENWPDGTPRHVWSGGPVAGGRYLLDGEESWYFRDGRLHYHVSWESGRKVGTETLWNQSGKRRWEWSYAGDGLAKWKQYYPDGVLKSESTWRDYRLHGVARRWDQVGHLISDWHFEDGYGEPE